MPMCVCECANTHKHTYRHAPTNAFAHICTSVCERANAHSNRGVPTHTHSDKRTRTHTRAYTDIRVRARTCTHKQTQALTHTHTRTNACQQKRDFFRRAFSLTCTRQSGHGIFCLYDCKRVSLCACVRTSVCVCEGAHTH